MKYLLSRLLMRAAVVGAKKPFSLMEAMLDLPIIVILPVRTYFSWSVFPCRIFNKPIRSLAAAAKGSAIHAGREIPSGPLPALVGDADLSAICSRACLVS